MIVFLLIWMIILTVTLALLALANLGKFSHMERGFFTNLENLEGVFAVSQTDFKNLKTSFENLRETVENLREVSQRIEQAENLIGGFNENLIDLKSDVELLLRVDKEHPVLAAPVERSKGGRPRKEG